MTVPAKIIAAKIRFSDFLKKFFSSRFNLFLFILTALFTFYYAFKVQERFDRYKIASNDTKNAVYVDVSEGKTFSIPIKTDSLKSIRLFCTTIDNHDFTEDDFSVAFSEIEEGFYTAVKFYRADNGGYIDILFPTYGASGLKNKLLHMNVSSNTILLKGVSDTELVCQQFGPKQKGKVFLVLFLFVLVVFGCFFIHISRRLKLYNRVFLFLLMLGAISLFIRPPLSLYDDLVHFDSAYNMSNIMMGKGDALKTGNFFKRDCDTKLFPNGNFIDEDHDHRIKISQHRYFAYLKSNMFKKYSTELIPVKTYAFLLPAQNSYFISALCISLVRILRLNQFFLYYFTCFVNLLIFSLLIRFGLKKNSAMTDNVICCITLFPVVILELASFSYDAMLFALAFTVINYAAFIFFSKEKKCRDIGILIVLSLLIFPVKTIYFPITGLIILLLFFNSNLKRRTKFVFLAGSVLVLYIVVFALAQFSHISRFTHRVMTDFCYAYSIADIVFRPVYFFKLVIYRLCDQYTPYSIDSFLGLFTLSDSLGDSLPKILENSFILIMLPLCCIRQKNKVLAVSSLTIFIIVSCFICLVSVIWTPLLQMDGHISGMQSRYFIPVLPLLFYSVAYFVPERFHISIEHTLDFELVLVLFYFIDRFFLVFQ